MAAYGDLSASPGLNAAHKAMEIDPQLASAHHALAMNLHQFGRLQEALRGPPAGRSNSIPAMARAERYQLRLRHRRTIRRGADALEACARADAETAGRVLPRRRPAPVLEDDARTERFLTAAADPVSQRHAPADPARLLDLRRGQPQAASSASAAPQRSANNIEVLLARAEIARSPARDAPASCARSSARAADGLFGNAPYPIKLLHAYQLHRAGSQAKAATLIDEILAANRRRWPARTGRWSPYRMPRSMRCAAMQRGARRARARLRRRLARRAHEGDRPLLASDSMEPRFAQLLSRIEADVAAMRARADYSAIP